MRNNALIEHFEKDLKKLREIIERYDYLYDEIESLADEIEKVKIQRDIAIKLFNSRSQHERITLIDNRTKIQENDAKTLHWDNMILSSNSIESVKNKHNIERDIGMATDLGHGMPLKDVAGKWLVNRSQPEVALAKKMKSRDFKELVEYFRGSRIKLDVNNRYYCCIKQVNSK